MQRHPVCPHGGTVVSSGALAQARLAAMDLAAALRPSLDHTLLHYRGAEFIQQGDGGVQAVIQGLNLRSRPAGR